MSKWRQLPRLAVEDAKTLTPNASSLVSPQAWLRLPAEIRYTIYDLVWGSKEVDCCGCSVAMCEYGCAVRCVDGCLSLNPLHGQDIPVLLNPRLNLLLVSRSVYYDVTSIPQQRLIGTVHSLRCLNNLLLRGNPTFLGALSQLRLRRKHIATPRNLNRILRLAGMSEEEDAYDFGARLGRCYEAVKAVAPQINTTKHELPVMRRNPDTDTSDKVKAEIIVDIETIFELGGFKGHHQAEVTTN